MAEWVAMGDAVELAIIGGGIVGCSAAAFAAERGVRVRLFERAEIGAGASGRNMGAVQHPFDPELVPLHEETVAMYRQLAALGSLPFPERPAGLLMVADERSVLEAQLPALAAIPELRAELLGPRQVRALEPELADGLWAIRLETGSPIPPHAATATMAERARAAGARFELGEAAVPAIEHGRAVGVLVSGPRQVPADLVLVASGPWSPYLLDPSGRWLPIVATWGATAQLEMAAPPRHVIEEARVETVNRPADADGTGKRLRPEDAPSLFTIAAAGGVAIIGSTFLASEPDARAMAPLLLERGARFLPALRDAGVSATRSCARPQSVDGRPLVGQVAGVEGLHLCAGHGPWGISCGPATARLAVDALLDPGTRIPDALQASRAGAPQAREVSI